MDTGQKIHDLRTEKELTLEELGDIVGVGKSTVRKWENGMIANMRRDKLIKVAKALDTTPSYLMGWKDDEKSPAALQGKEEAILVKKYSQLSESNKMAVLTLIDNLLVAQSPK